ncbi:PaeR7I family type II restriction endonuclease [Streptomyces sp. 769]|uniref:PaeR7I family type II restriction endonuclease n=1 Tax=Streptomyces sp. 769 TaxID=1262452 RepID=UPI00068E3302|nr:PaeR7I family type II restriction endonuclease [Streptomyces sp. 769]
MKPEVIQQAVTDFWSKRGEQRDNQADGGKAGGEARANGHIKGFEAAVKGIFLDCDIPAGDIRTGKPYLPGYYRVRKQWDLVVLYKEVLVAALEFKSQVGSVGKNFNNRFEEALGSATDLAAAQKKNGPFGAVPPWLGYVFVLEETEETEKLNRQSHALFEIDPAFKGMSYTQRYQEMISRFVGENVYDIGWFITTQRAEDGSITYKEPLPTATARTLQVAIEGRVKLVKAMLGE